jgi:hypothetical protein
MPSTSYDTLDFCGQIRRQQFGQRRRLPLWGADQLVLWVFYNEKLVWQHFRDMTQSLLAIILVFIGKWPMLNLLMMLSTYTTLYDERAPTYNTTLGNKSNLILKPRSTPSSTPIITMSNYLVLMCNCQHVQASNARIHWLGYSSKLTVSILASSALCKHKTSLKLCFVY